MIRLLIGVLGFRFDNCGIRGECGADGGIFWSRELCFRIHGKVV